MKGYFCDFVAFGILQNSHIQKAQWLSLADAFERIFNLLETLISYFNSEGKPLP